MSGIDAYDTNLSFLTGAARAAERAAVQAVTQTPAATPGQSTSPRRLRELPVRAARRAAEMAKAAR